MKNFKYNILAMILLSIFIPVCVIAFIYIIALIISMATSLFAYFLIIAAICSISTMLIYIVNKNKPTAKILMICLGLALIISGIILLVI